MKSMLDIRVAEFLEACDSGCLAIVHVIDVFMARDDLDEEDIDNLQEVRDETMEVSAMVSDFTEGTIPNTVENLHTLQHAMANLGPERIAPFLAKYRTF